MPITGRSHWGDEAGHVQLAAFHSLPSLFIISIVILVEHLLCVKTCAGETQ